MIVSIYKNYILNSQNILMAGVKNRCWINNLAIQCDVIMVWQIVTVIKGNRNMTYFIRLITTFKWPLMKAVWNYRDFALWRVTSWSYNEGAKWLKWPSTVEFVDCRDGCIVTNPKVYFQIKSLRMTIIRKLELMSLS